MYQEPIECLSIKPNSIVSYLHYQQNSTRAFKTPFSNKRVKNQLSNKSAKRMREAINWLFLVSRNKRVYSKATGKYFTYRVNFITLTLSSRQVHSDEWILKNMLEPFLRKIRTKFPGSFYVWKAETQDNGNIHFHVNTNVFIHHSNLRTMWNDIQKKHGYVKNFRTENPNSTDVKAVKNADALGAYMFKYMSKGDLYKAPLKRYHRIHKEKLLSLPICCNIPKRYFSLLKRRLTCKLWDCSSLLKGIKINVCGIDCDTSYSMNVLTAGKTRIFLDYAILYLDIDFRNNANLPLSKFMFESLKEQIEHESKMSTSFSID